MLLGSVPLMFQLVFLDVAETGAGSRSVSSVLTDAWDKLGEPVRFCCLVASCRFQTGWGVVDRVVAHSRSFDSLPQQELRSTLTGTAVCWFLFDIVFYGNALFTSAAVDLLGVGQGQNAVAHVISVSLVALMVGFVWVFCFRVEERRAEARGEQRRAEESREEQSAERGRAQGTGTRERQSNIRHFVPPRDSVLLIFLTPSTHPSTQISLAGLPGFAIAVCYVDELGRKAMQLYSFCALGVVFFALSIWAPFSASAPGAFLALYATTFLLCNMGPNPCTYILSSESYPKKVRSSFAGLSAAAGKLGGAVGASCFEVVLKAFGEGQGERTGLAVVLASCAVISLCGAAVTHYFVLDLRGKDLGGLLRVWWGEGRACDLM